MTRPVLVLRPEPGAARTAERALALGLCPVVSPLFEVRPLPWTAPDPAGFDALLLTSANAARSGAASLGRLTGLPCFAVGDATAIAARNAGFGIVTAGPSDGAAALALMAGAGVRRALHLCGRDHLRLHDRRVRLERIPVYAAEAVPFLPREAAEALAEGAVALVHSPRAGARLAELVANRSGICVAAISQAAAEASGEGWAKKAAADAPRDEALLELAARLCKNGDPEA